MTSTTNTTADIRPQDQPGEPEPVLEDVLADLVRMGDTWRSQ